MRRPSAFGLSCLLACGLLASAAAPALAFTLPQHAASGLPARPVVLAQSSAEVAEQSLRIAQMEEQMRQLNGRIDELTFQLQQLQELLRRMQEDTEFRFQELQGGTGKRSEAPVNPPAPEQADVAVAAPHDGEVVVLGNVDDLGAVAEDGPTDLSAGFSIDGVDPDSGGQILGTLPALPGVAAAEAPVAAARSAPAGGPLDLSAIARGDAAAPADPLTDGALAGSGDELFTATPAGATEVALLTPPDDPREAYDQAYNAMVNGDYASAEAGFRSFLASHPDSSLAGNAHFWLGESLYVRGDLRGAADAFLTTYRDYPKNPKAAESLLKLGLALEGLGERDAACATYGEVERKFPGAQGALLARVANQKATIGC